MIELVNVSKYYPTDFGRHYVFRDVSLVLPPDRSVGVLGPNGAGKSTFLRLIGGADIPSEGSILRTGRISPPMGLTPGLQSSLTGSENARFAGRICGLPREEINGIIEYVRELSGIGKYFDMPVASYSAGMKQRVAFAINMSMNFDYYLFDEISAGGDKDFRKITRAMVQERLKTSKFVIASHRTDELLDICDSGIVIQNGELTFYDDIKDALDAYGGDDEDAERKARRARRHAAAPQPAEDGADHDTASRADDEERRIRREQRIIQLQQRKAAVAAQLAAASAAAPAAEEDRNARREQRRQQLALRQQSVAAPVAEAEVAAAAEAGGGDDERGARREQRRQQLALRQQKIAAARAARSAAAAPDEGASAGAEDSHGERPREPRPEAEAASEPPAPVAPAPPVGTAPMARRVKPQPPPAAPLSVPPMLRNFAVERALARQDRAQAAAARASRLLLQHLDDQAASGSPGTRARAWLAAAAQETAAMEAAQAREMLESTLAGIRPAQPASAFPVPRGAGLLRPAAAAPANPE